MLPASQPTKAPIAKNIIKLMISMLPPVLILSEQVYANNKTGSTSNVKSHYLIRIRTCNSLCFLRPVDSKRLMGVPFSIYLSDVS
jgi:hypothetical protein